MNNNSTIPQINLLVCISGSVASIKIPELINQLLLLSNQRTDDNEYNINIKLLFSSEKAKYFFEKSKIYDPIHWSRYLLSSSTSQIMIVYEEDEWNLWQQMGDPVLHIELRKWADIIVIAPTSANLLAKIAAGIADSLLLSMLRAIDFSSNSSLQQQQVFICPAMNTAMWTHPSTNQQIKQLEQWGYQIIPPVAKKLACGDEGVGALASIDTIVESIKTACRLIIRTNRPNPNNKNKNSATSNTNNHHNHAMSENSINNNNNVLIEEISGTRRVESSNNNSNNNLDHLLHVAASIRRKDQRNLQLRNILIATGPMMIGMAIGATVMSFLFAMKKK